MKDAWLLYKLLVLALTSNLRISNGYIAFDMSHYRIILVINSSRSYELDRVSIWALSLFLLCCLVPARLLNILRSAQTTAQWKHTDLVIVAIRRVWHTQRTALACAIALCHRDSIDPRIDSIAAIVALLAHVVRTETMKQCHTAAILAFPVDLGFAVLFAIALPSAYGFQSAIFAP